MAEHEYIEFLIKSKLFHGLTEEQCRQVCREIKPSAKNYCADEVFLREGEKVSSIAVITDGYMRGERLSFEGDVHLLNVYEPGEIIGLDIVRSREATSPLTFVSQGKSSLLVFPWRNLENCSAGEKIKDNVIAILSNENIRRLYKVDVLSKRGLRERIMTHLEIMQHMAGSDFFSLRMSREQMAQYLCVNRSALSHELNEMKREGIIDFDKDVFRIKK